MTKLCRATTKTGRPCKAGASRWPRGVDGDPQLCGRHLPVRLREIRDAGFAELERRRAERLDARVPACWSWESTLPFDRLAAEYALPAFPGAYDDFLHRLRSREEHALRRAFWEWHANRCAVCGFPDARLVEDHDHDTGFIRGLLCRSCNGKEPHDNGLFRRYRERSPARILDIHLRYWDRFQGWAQPRDATRDQLDNHPAYALASRLAERLQPEGEAG